MTKIAAVGHLSYTNNITLMNVDDPWSDLFPAAVLAAANPSATSGAITDLAWLGSRYLVAPIDGSHPGFRVIDCATPSSPSVVGVYESPGFTAPTDLKVRGSYAYIVAEDWDPTFSRALFIFDLSDPAAPTLAGKCRMEGTAFVSEEIAAVTLLDTLAVLGVRDTGGLATVDISNPAAPTFEGYTYDVAALVGKSATNCTDMEAIPGTDRVVVPLWAGADTGVYIVDVGTGPFTVVGYGRGVDDVRFQGIEGSCWLTPGATLVGSAPGGGRVNVIDVSNPAAPTGAASHLGGGTVPYTPDSDGSAIYVPRLGSNQFAVMDPAFTMTSSYGIGSLPWVVAYCDVGPTARPAMSVGFLRLG